VSRRALNERDAHFVLQPLDLLRQGGLRDVLTRGRSREVRLLSERDEVTKLAKLHKYSL